MQKLHGLFHDTDWKESLINEIYNLICTTFTFSCRKLIDEVNMELIEKSGSEF